MEGVVTFVGVLLPTYVGPLVILICPILLAPRLRRHLARREFTVVLYSPLVWGLLTIMSSRPKGMTNAYVELFLLAIGVAVGVYLRVGLRKVIDARHGALFVPTVACLWAAVVVMGMPVFRHFDLVGAWWYVRGHPELTEPMREAILHGVVVEGMSADEATAAGGPYIWLTEGGELTRLSFNNLSQFGSDHPVAFNAHIVRIPLRAGRLGSVRGPILWSRWVREDIAAQRLHTDSRRKELRRLGPEHACRSARSAGGYVQEVRAVKGVEPACSRAACGERQCSPSAADRCRRGPP